MGRIGNVGQFRRVPIGSDSPGVDADIGRRTTRNRLVEHRAFLAFVFAIGQKQNLCRPGAVLAEPVDDCIERSAHTGSSTTGNSLKSLYCAPLILRSARLRTEDDARLIVKGAEQKVHRRISGSDYLE